ncbi:MAG: hypothetical protein AB4290_29530 [Spirulina sp.]
MMTNPLTYWDRLIQLQSLNPRGYIQRGMVYFKLARIEAAIADFDRAEYLDPQLTPYLWQRGLAYYYCDRFAEGAKQFEIDLTVNSNDVEETIWRYLCLARDRGLKEAQTSLLPIKNDPRRVMREIYQLYAECCQPEDVLKLGEREGKRGQFYSHLYVGLYYEARGEETRSREYIVKAARDFPLDDYMWHLARVHQKLRNWE